MVTAVRDYGEEQRWRAVVRAILAARGTGKLQRTSTLAALVEQAVTAGRWQPGRIHAATRTFQGIRIFVNRELEVIEAALPKAFGKLKSGGILAVISFHSLEDRIVKRYFRHLAGQPEHANDNRSQQERIVQATLLTRRPLTPDAAETEINPRSRSAKLRALQKGSNLI
ncbi:MAG: 16S rRNA (cytosine(1402)-N(4))-methyltransferase [Verrucomicrobia bacterium]|nr:16S rRNA (cytosine(1402)-N(4))-methyltransferase [Verrucomicrobiota bacterium]